MHLTLHEIEKKRNKRKNRMETGKETRVRQIERL
jgi:hypothetical protein